jgi:hypothetical protein
MVRPKLAIQAPLLDTARRGCVAPAAVWGFAIAIQVSERVSNGWKAAICLKAD